MNITKLTQTDVVSCANIEAEVLDSWTLEQIADDLTNPNIISFVMKDEKNVVGFCSFEYVCKEASLGAFSIDSAHRKNGYGKELMAHCVSYFKDRNADLMYLEVRSENAPAINLYKNFGFKELQTRKGFYKNPSDDAICMGLNFSEDNIC